MAYSFDGLKGEYTRLLARMVIKRVAEAKSAAARLYRERARYKTVEEQTGVPWRVIAILHNREAGGSFAGVLHNGEKIIGKPLKTKLVPAGRGPFRSWEDAAVDALRLKNLHLVKDWSRERICFVAEGYNGWGYRNKGVPSAYLWAGSNNYVSGKYVADHVWSSSAIDQQLGCMVVYDYLAMLGETDGSEKPFPPPPDIEPAPTPPAKSSFLSILLAILRAIFKRG